MAAVAAVIVDSRNIFHQAGDAIGIRARPTVPGVRAALARLGFQVGPVHVGLALARPSDQAALAGAHAANLAYRQNVLADGGDVLLGELQRRPGGAVEEKVVDCACCVRITRYVDEIAYHRSSIEAIVVLSKDLDLTPAIDYAVSMSVPVFAASQDVIQHRPHPYVLLGPHSYAELTGRSGSGHDLREQLVRVLYDQQPLRLTVEGSRQRPVLRHPSGLRAIAAQGVSLGPRGTIESLYPVDVTWDRQVLGSFPILVCARKPRGTACWSEAIVRRRTAPMTVELRLADGARGRQHFLLGGVVPGDRVLVHGPSGRVLGRLGGQPAPLFDPDTPQVLRIIAPLPDGGARAIDAKGIRGLLMTNQALTAGTRIAAVQIDVKPRGPVWAAISSPLP